MKKSLIIAALLLAALLIVTGCQSAPMAEEPMAEEPMAEEPMTEEPMTEEPMAEEPSMDEAAAPAGDYDGVRFSATALDGATVDESYLQKNKVTVVNFWATWCPPCVGEIPDFSEVAAAYAGKGVGFLGVQLDEDTDTAKDMWESGGIVYPTVMPQGDLLEIGNSLQYIPVTMLFGSDGKPIGDQQVGGMDKAKLESLLDTALTTVK